MEKVETKEVARRDAVAHKVRGPVFTQGERLLQESNLARAEQEVVEAKEAIASSDSNHADGKFGSRDDGTVGVAKTADDVRAENKADALRGSDNTVYSNADGSVTKTVGGKVVTPSK